MARTIRKVDNRFVGSGKRRWISETQQNAHRKLVTGMSDLDNNWLNSVVTDHSYTKE